MESGGWNIWNAIRSWSNRGYEYDPNILVDNKKTYIGYIFNCYFILTL